MKISTDDNSISHHLLKCGIDLEKIKPENLPSKEISVLNKALGIIKTNGDKNQKFWLFNEIEINEFISGKKTISFSRFPANRNDLEEIVNTLFKFCGSDSSHRELLLPYESIIFNKEVFSKIATREWIDFVDYAVDLKGYLESQTIVLTLIEK